MRPRRFGKNRHSLRISQIIMYGLFPSASFMVLIVLLYISTGRNVSEAILAFTCGLIIAANAAIIFLLERMEQAMEREQQLFSLGQQLEVQVRSMESASKLFSEQRKKVHDYRSHLNTLRVLLQNHEYEPAEVYLNSVSKQQTERLFLVNTHHSILDACTIHISKSLLVFKDFGYQLTTTKESNIRDVDVAPEYMDFLKEYYKYWKSQKKLMGGSWQKSLDKKSSKYAPSLLALRGTDFVICNDHGFPINPDSYGALVRRIGQRAGIEGLHPHMFRHTFVSILLSNPEIGVATVAAEAGHAQPSTTLAIYTQVYDKRRKEIRNQMSKELYE